MSDSELYNVSTDDSSYSPVDRFDKSAFIIGQAVLVSLNILLNLAVIASVLYLHVKRREVAARSPQFIPMAACSVTQLGIAVWYSVVFLHEPRRVSPFSCSEYLAIAVSVNMMYTLIMLIVAAVVVAEAVRLQTLVAMTWTRRKVLAAVLVALDVLYVFAVIVPVFMKTQIDPSKPCYEGTNHVAYVRDEKARRILPAVGYIVPALYIQMACVTLIVVYCTRRSASFTQPSVGYVRFHSIPLSSTATPAGHGNDREMGPVDPSITFNTPNHGQPLGSSSDVALPVGAGTNNGNSPLSPGQEPPYPQVMPTSSNQLQPCHRGFPFNVILAAVACIVLLYVSYHGMLSRHSSVKLLLAGTMLDMMVHVFVPLSWLLDADIRSCGAVAADVAPAVLP